MKRPSFQFYPADWLRSRWVSFDFGNGDVFPRKPACYVVYLNGELSYIGQTVDLAKRVSAHGVRWSYGASILSNWGAHKSVVIKAHFGVRLGDWAMREIRLIHRLQPRLNCVGAKKKRVAA